MKDGRFYRNWCRDDGLVSFRVTVKDSDLWVRAGKRLENETLESVTRHRKAIEGYIERDASFKESLEPVDVAEGAPLIVKAMGEAARKAGVGPMAAVAGAIAEFAGKDMLRLTDEIILENGGDIFMRSLKPRRVGIYAGASRFTGKVALEIDPNDTPLGICTSSGTVGHSLSFGRSDAVVIVSDSALLADAAATATGNVVREETDIEAGMEFARKIEGVRGVLIVKNDKMGIWGSIKLAEKSH